MTNKFSFKPAKHEFLTEHVESVEWSAVDKEISLVICETPELEVCEWITHLQQTSSERAKSPFVNEKSACADLIFKNENDVLLKTIHFKGISLKTHKCVLQKTLVNCTRHMITLNYEIKSIT